MNYDKQIETAQEQANSLLMRIEKLQWWRAFFTVIGIILVSFAGLMHIFKIGFLNQYEPYLHYAIGGLGFLFIAISLAMSEDTLRIRRAKALADVSAYQAVKSYSETRDKASGIYIDNLGQVVLSHTSQYFQFVLSNVQRSSRLATSMMAGGFLLIAAGVWVGIQQNNNGPIAYVTSGIGLLLELLTTAILVFNRESVELMNSYMKKLESFSQTLLALSLLDASPNNQQRESMINKWFEQLVNISFSPSTAPLVSGAVGI